MGRKKLVYGLGINDLDYVVKPSIEGKRVVCPFYARWHNVLNRCTRTLTRNIDSPYSDTEISDKWIYFSEFRTWMGGQIWEGLELDRDILFPGNRIYGPDTCAFVPHMINKVLADYYSTDGLPKGVAVYDKTLKSPKSYIAQCSHTGKTKCLGYFKTPESAHKAWQWAKAAQIEYEISEYAKQECFREDIAEALTSKVWKIRLQHAENQITKSLKEL